MNGILIINKPLGYTSHDVVNVLRKKLNLKQIGHTGTLDPNATGVLPILVGQATKISKYLVEHNKTYIAELKLGEKSSTGDLEGEILETKNIPELKVDEIQEVLKNFIGKQEQIPPIYSAIKVNGKKAYEYARNNQEIQLKPREIEIIDIELIKFESNVVKYKVNCSKGTYIRTLCEQIAEKLGTVGLMQSLCRTKVNEFSVEDAIDLDKIKQEDNKNIINKLISIEEMFKNKNTINLDNRKTELFLNGVKLTFKLKDDIYRVYNNNSFLGLGIIKDELLKRDVII